MATPPVVPGGAADSLAETNDVQFVSATTRSARPDLKRPLLRCAQCGASGSAPTIAPNDGVILVPIFGARADGGPAMLCGDCRRGGRG
jgi:hypothetical protein